MEEQKSSPMGAVVRDLFEKELDRVNIAYRSDAENNILRIKYSGTYFEGVTFTFLFDEDGRSAALSVYSIAAFPRNRMQDVTDFCNRVNQKYRWLRFFADGDCELTAAADLAFAPGGGGIACLELLRQSVNTLNAVCKELNA